MENIIHVTTSDFEDVVLNSRFPVIIDFYADWCGPCKALAPVLEDIVSENQNRLIIAKINVDDEPDISRQFSIMSIPTLVLIENGVEKNRMVGLNSKENIIKNLGI